MARGVAAGDTVEVSDARTCAFNVVERAGNLAVQVYLAPGLGRAVESDLAPAISRIGGALDDLVDNALAVFTIPVSSGFEQIESILNGFVDRHPDAKWYYGNVYDQRDGVTPLGWWESQGPVAQ